VLDRYYLESDTKSIKSVEKSMDSRGDTILDNYEKALNERNTEETDLGYMSGEVLAVVKGGIKEEDIPALFEDDRMSVTAVSDYTNGKKLVKLSISLEDTVESAIEKLEENSYVDYVQKDYVYKSESIYAEEVLNDYYADNLYYLNAVNAPEAWEFIKGVPHEKVRVGIIDTGAQLDHPDLENVINKDLSVRITCDGIIAPLKGDNGLHGTHVSGIVAAQANNKTGVAGTASDINNDLIELVEIGSDTGTGNSLSAFVIYKAVLYAIDNNIRVINMSLGGATDPDNIFQTAVDLAIKSGCVVVCAAGNDNSSDYAYPSDCSGAISVIALDESCQGRASYSNYGGTDNKVSAPGTNILSTIPESFGAYNFLKGYEKLSGTSMATPVVTAEAAMILSVNPSLTSTAVKEIIYNTCTDMGEKGYDKSYGYGKVNICEAVKTAYNTPSNDMPKWVKLSSSGITITKGDTCKVSATVTTTGNNKEVYYHTEDNGIAKVSQDGTITGVSDGETKLVVSTENSITAQCVIKVKSLGETKLDAPKVDEIQTGAYTGARINWSKIDRADYYQVYATTGDDETFRYIGSTTSPSYSALMGLGGEEVPASNVTKYKIKAVSRSSSYKDSDFSHEFVYVYVGQEPNLKADQLLEQGKSTGLLIHWGAIVSSKLYRKSSLDGKQVLLATFGEDMTKNYYEDTDLTVGVTYTYTLKLFTEYKGVEYSEITSELVINYLDDDPFNPTLGKCDITSAEFSQNSAKVTCVSPSNCLVQQCLCSDNNGKSWFDALNAIGEGGGNFYLDGLEFGKTYLVKHKAFENQLFGLYRDRCEYSDTITLTMPNPLETPVIKAKWDNSTGVNISWNNTEDGDYYTLYRKTGGVWEKLADNIYGTSYYDGTISSGKIYYYKVISNKKSPDFKAVKSNGVSIVTKIGTQQSADSNIAFVNTNSATTKKHLMSGDVSQIPKQTYTGGEIRPQIEAFYDGVLLAEGKDYTLEYTSNTEPGTGYAVLTGTGEYDGKYVVPFEIADKTEYKYHTVTYKDYDGSIIKTLSVKEGETLEKLRPAYREGYKFVRWDKEVTKVYEDITLTAIYSKADKMFNVAFLDKEGKVIDRQLVAYGESANAPSAPDYENYTFAGWGESTSHITKSIVVKPVYRATTFAGGNGTENSPYLISNREQLDLFSSLVNSSEKYASASYKLTSDIMYNDLADCEYWGNDNRTNEANDPQHIWTPAGTEEMPFSGKFDGNGHTVTGLYVFTSNDYAGFIGYGKNADILCLKLNSSYIKTEKSYAGAVAGKFENTSNNEHKIQACCVSESMIIGNGVAGGLVGQFESNGSTNTTVMSNCYSEGCYVYSLWDSIAGGLIGRVISKGNTMEIRYCYAFNEILLNYSNSQMEPGYLIGSFKATYDNNAWCQISNCYYDAYDAPIHGYDELCRNEGPYTFTNLVGFTDKNDKKVSSNYSMKKYSGSDSNTRFTDNVWVLGDGDVPRLYFEKEKYTLKYYLDDRLISVKYYSKGDRVESPERYYQNDYISTDWEFSDDDFDGIMPGKDIEAYAQKYKCGDVNGDGEVTVKDVTLIQKYLTGGSAIQDAPLISADVNADGEIDIQDCTEIQKYATHYITSLKGAEIPDAQLFSQPPIPTLKTITLIDGTPQNWLGNDGALFELYDKNSGISYPMEKSGDVWVAEVPVTVSSVIIRRVSPVDGTVWNYWESQVDGSTFTATASGTGTWS
ncbi:MAG: S8 family serine peptidase, partial [Ruminococcus sp.]